jgi:glutaredoxin-like protein
VPETRIVIYGVFWCPDCLRARKFFDAHGITYQWVNIDRDAHAEAFVLTVNNGMRSVPTICFEDGSILVEPSNRQLAKKLGISM